MQYWMPCYGLLNSVYKIVNEFFQLQSCPSTAGAKKHAIMVQWKMWGAECGVRSVENAECGKCGVWKKINKK